MSEQSELDLSVDLRLRDFFLADVEIVGAREGCVLSVVLERSGTRIAQRTLQWGTATHMPEAVTFVLEDGGVYRAAIYSNEGNSGPLAVSSELVFDGFPAKGFEPNVTRERVAIVGVTRFAASVLRILETRFEVVGFETGDVGRQRQSFCGKRIEPLLKFDAGVYRVVVDEMSSELTWGLQCLGAQWEVVFNTGRGQNRVTYCVDRLDIYKAQRLAHEMWNSGLHEGARLIYARMYLNYNSSVPFELDLDPSVKFGYGGIGVVIHKATIIGRNVKISQNVTIGARHNRVPVIEDGVFIGPGAVVLGARVGAGATIAANAVVIDDVAPGATVVAPLGRVLLSKKL